MNYNRLYLVITVSIVLMGCSKKPPRSATKDLTATMAIDSIAAHYGINDFYRIDSLLFTFHVNHQNGTFARRWKWQPKEGMVTYISDTSRTTFHRSNLPDSSTMKMDAGFVNDKYWLLFPFQLKWDSTQVTFNSNAAAPVSGQTLSSLKLVYPENSGYTPGDSYTVYFDSTFTIREWTYCPHNDCSKGRSYAWTQRVNKGPFTFTTRFENKEGTASIEMKGLKVYTH